MTVPILIDLNIEKNSKSCDGCVHNIETYFGYIFCGIFLSKSKKGVRGKKCLRAQQRAEDWMSNGC